MRTLNRIQPAADAVTVSARSANIGKPVSKQFLRKDYRNIGDTLAAAMDTARKFESAGYSVTVTSRCGNAPWLLLSVS